MFGQRAVEKMQIFAPAEQPLRVLCKKMADRNEKEVGIFLNKARQLNIKLMAYLYTVND